ncbi:T9SS type A sorting domain-containing protein [Chryseobacterium sp. RP-3-3]|uniref:T9SS type A sorting domain-containing protein n=1 Tax=Chryseobacterium antibioticum TaxID=2728847 RepID=A0A7Y0FQZ2_9FLAO|nr:T9SS type A sorting domain-containing protein [Chryseobacterium antibioticum]NML69106.1 T9SS type A sorting domain-containing protein [Chryseobacterium antibioticum]
MKKIFTVLGLATLAMMNAQSFTATYDFEGTPPTTTGAVAGAGSSNLVAGNFTTTGYTQTTTGNRFAHSGAPTATTPDLTKYLQVTVTPNAGVSLSVSSITFRSQRSGTGPRSYIVRSNADSYAANLPASINPANAELEVTGTNVLHFVNDCSTCSGQNGNTLTPANISNITTPVTFRVYFFEAEATGGTFSIDDVIITGTATSGALGTSENFTTKLNFVKNTFVKSDEITFGADVKDVKVYNMFGQVVKSASVKQNEAVNVAELAKGNYIVTGTVNNEPISQKILKD